MLATVVKSSNGIRETMPVTASSRLVADDYLGFDGLRILLKGGRLLVPDGPIDFPFDDGHGKKAT